MQVCLAEIHGRPVTFALDNGLPLLNGEAVPIKGITEADLQSFQTELDSIPASSDPGHAALINAVRANFITKLLSRAVGEECVDELTHILGHVHDEVISYLENE